MYSFAKFMKMAAELLGGYKEIAKGNFENPL